MLAELPTELISHILSYLKDEDLYRCSGTCQKIYQLSNWELSMRCSSLVYRWPNQLHEYYYMNNNSLAVVGNNSLKEVVEKCKGLHRIIIASDGTYHTKILSILVLKFLLKKFGNELKYLDLLYLEIEEHHIELILTYTQEIILNIKMLNKEDMTIGAIRMLYDHRELFSSFNLHYDNEYRLYLPRDQALTMYEQVTLPNVDNIKAYCPNVCSFKFELTLKLTRLTLIKVNSLDVNSLQEISTMPTLKHFHIEGINNECVTHTQLALILSNGFNNLFSLNIIKCKQLNYNVILSISTKINLRRLFIDLRFTLSDYLHLLHKLDNLIQLTVILSAQYRNNVRTIKNNWKKLKIFNELDLFNIFDIENYLV